VALRLRGSLLLYKGQASVFLQKTYIVANKIQCNCGRTASKRFSIAFFVVPQPKQLNFVDLEPKFGRNLTLWFMMLFLLLVYAMCMVRSF